MNSVGVSQKKANLFCWSSNQKASRPQAVEGAAHLEPLSLFTGRIYALQIGSAGAECNLELGASLGVGAGESGATITQYLGRNRRNGG
jgi:hypothetical protein